MMLKGMKWQPIMQLRPPPEPETNGLTLKMLKR